MPRLQAFKRGWTMLSLQTFRLVWPMPRLQALKLVWTMSRLQAFRLVWTMPRIQAFKLVWTMSRLQELRLVWTMPRLQALRLVWPMSLHIFSGRNGSRFMHLECISITSVFPPLNISMCVNNHWCTSAMNSSILSLVSLTLLGPTGSKLIYSWPSSAKKWNGTWCLRIKSASRSEYIANKFGPRMDPWGRHI